MVEEAPTDGGLPILPVAAGLVALALIGAFLAMRRRSTDEPVAQP